MKKIIISEKSERMLFSHLINEEITYMGDKEDVVMKWLNDYFIPTEHETEDEMGMPKINKTVSMLNSKKQITKKIISLERVFYMMQTKFKNILQDKKERDDFLWTTINKWYKQ